MAEEGMQFQKQENAANEFYKTWGESGYEKGQTQGFWLALLHDVYGVNHPDQYIKFEVQVHQNNTNFIDAYIPRTKVLIEQKSRDIDLRKPIRQSDGSVLTPYQQAVRYTMGLPLSEHPRWIITCNFMSFLIYDMQQPNCPPEEVKLENLSKEYYRLQFLVDPNNVHVKREEEVSFQTGEIVGQLYDALYARYRSRSSAHSQHSLNVLCVRLVFCLYAENSGLFGYRGIFHDYLATYGTHQMRQALVDLFKILDTKIKDRDPYQMQDNPLLSKFPYVNGGLFSEQDIEIPSFTDEIRTLILNTSENYDWSGISPTIFGAVFESTLNLETRRHGGMHYTSVENIHKVIDSLFLDDLTKEFNEICKNTVERSRNIRLRNFQKKLASLTFLDPACGSGNFLTETYMSLRRLENSVILALSPVAQIDIGVIENPIRVLTNQFYGIEINDFAVAVAKTALWIAEWQMMCETEDIVTINNDFLPLTPNINIVEANAVRIEWDNVVPRDKLTYIIGNPPFNGARMLNANQKADRKYLFANWKNYGDLDYVSCWFKKASDYMYGTKIRAALVATNSLVQGESVGILWAPLFESGVHIDFAYRSFRWDSEARIKAHVFCVIVGFSLSSISKEKIIYSDGNVLKAKNINGYLLDAENFCVLRSHKPICDVPKIAMGNQPIDDGNYLFTVKEMNNFISNNNLSDEYTKYFKPWYGADEYIESNPRYCMWLGDCSEDELSSMPDSIKERIDAVTSFREQSSRAQTRLLANKPTQFGTKNMPQGEYLVIPETSSEKRYYIPMGFLSSDVLCGNSMRLMPGASLYHFGVLVSNVHMDWMRVVGGRLKTDYRYSIHLIYNNFPWPNANELQKKQIKETARAILDARKAYPNKSLEDLYSEDMKKNYPILWEAHLNNDKAVMAAYGWGQEDDAYSSEAIRVAELMKLYRKYVSKKSNGKKKK